MQVGLILALYWTFMLKAPEFPEVLGFPFGIVFLTNSNLLLVIIQPRRTSDYKPALFWFSVFALAWMSLLLYAGGFTTSIEAGMAFLDWPLSNGSLNPEGWLQESDQLAEHSHRLLGMKMGLLSILLFGLSFLFEARREVRIVALTLLILIVVQGVLGGLRVLLDQQNLQTDSNGIARVFLILHACGAQITLCTMVTLTMLLSKSWIRGGVKVVPEQLDYLKRIGNFAVVALFVQLLLGAFIRHFKAAAIFGTSFPLLTEDFMGIHSLFPGVWNLQVTVHYLHRIWAIVVCVALLFFYSKLWTVYASSMAARTWLVVPTLLLSLQIFLGALVVWTLRNPYAATIHTFIGAGILAITWGHWVYLRNPGLKKKRSGHVS